MIACFRVDALGCVCLCIFIGKHSHRTADLFLHHSPLVLVELADELLQHRRRKQGIKGNHLIHYEPVQLLHGAMLHARLGRQIGKRFSLKFVKMHRDEHFVVPFLHLPDGRVELTQHFFERQPLIRLVGGVLLPRSRAKHPSLKIARSISMSSTNIIEYLHSLGQQHVPGVLPCLLLRQKHGRLYSLSESVYLAVIDLAVAAPRSVGAGRRRRCLPAPGSRSCQLGQVGKHARVRSVVNFAKPRRYYHM